MYIVDAESLMTILSCRKDKPLNEWITKEKLVVHVCPTTIATVAVSLNQFEPKEQKEAKDKDILLSRLDALKKCISRGDLDFKDTEAPVSMINIDIETINIFIKLAAYIDSGKILPDWPGELSVVTDFEIMVAAAGLRHQAIVIENKNPGIFSALAGVLPHKYGELNVIQADDPS